MRKSWAISWLIPAVCILLLHTLVPHAHDNNHAPEPHRCEGKSADLQHFLEHLLAVDAGVEHLEHTFVSESEQTQSVFALPIAAALPTFAAVAFPDVKTQPIAFFPFLLDKILILSSPFRGPPTVF